MPAVAIPRPRLRRLSLRAASILAALILLTGAGVGLLVRFVAFADDSQPARPELQRVLDSLVRGSNRIAPGATAYVSGPKGTWVGSAGVASVKTGQPMPLDARMRLESVSKIYTAALVLSLAQEGKLRVTDTVEKWLPRLLPYGDEITIRQLLTMTSGMIDNNDIVASDAAFRGYLARVGDAKLRGQLSAIAARFARNPALEISPTWWIRFAAWQPLLFPPGTGSHYSNIGYEVLGLIAERASGMSAARLFDDRIFEPLGLRATALDPQGPIAGPHATGYSLGVGGKLTDATDQHTGIGVEGGLVSDARETAAFLVGLMRGKLIDEKQLAGMRGPNLWRGGELSGCAGRAYGWSGGGTAYKTNVWVNADGSRVAVLLLNARDRTGGDFGDQTAGNALATLYCAA